MNGPHKRKPLKERLADAYREGADDATREWEASHAKDNRLADAIARLQEDLPKFKTLAEQQLLDTIAATCERLGDDPRFYEITSEDCGELAKWNPLLPAAINAYLNSLLQKAST